MLHIADIIDLTWIFAAPHRYAAPVVPLGVDVVRVFLRKKDNLFGLFVAPLRKITDFLRGMGIPPMK